MSTNGDKKEPVAKFGPYGGGMGSSIECSVWKNEVKEGEHAGKFFYGIRLKRSFKKGVDNAGKPLWEEAKGSHSLQDIPVLIYALQQAYSWILEQKVSDNEEARAARAAEFPPADDNF